MNTLLRTICLTSLVVSFLSLGTLHADTFGVGGNQFNIDFVTIGNSGNAADTTGVPTPAGSVSYNYRMGKYEISRDMVLKANASDPALGITMASLGTAGGNGLNRPASGITWLEAATFVNWLNTSSGSTAAYKFNAGNIENWVISDAGYNAANPFRNANAKYFLPSVDEWYKAAFYDPQTGTYFDYATGENSAPISTTGGTAPGTAVYNHSASQGPADITNAGGLSFYGTMAQSGNVWEWNEGAFDGTNDVASEDRAYRGGGWSNAQNALRKTTSFFGRAPNLSDSDTLLGFRVASIPEPGSGIMIVLALGWAMRRRK
jgi:formylglycine-generating enzyme required for sulfatase activity